MTIMTTIQEAVDQQVRLAAESTLNMRFSPALAEQFRQYTKRELAAREKAFRQLQEFSVNTERALNQKITDLQLENHGLREEIDRLRGKTIQPQSVEVASPPALSQRWKPLLLGSPI